MRILADSWYAGELTDATALDERIPRPLRAIFRRVGIARGFALFLAGRRADVIVTTNASPGASTCAVLCGLAGMRKLVLLEYIVHPPNRSDPVRKLYFGFVRRLMLGRALLAAQVLSSHEATRYPAVHRIPADRFQVLRWPGRFDDSPLPALNEGRRVLASGRRTDWPTFFAAANGTDWDVHVVCTAEDLPTVRELAGGAAIRCEIPADEHQAEVAAATVYVVPVRETGASIGQIRVMNAAQAGVPLVASDVVGLRDYVDPSCAILVPPGDPSALRDAVNALLGDPARRDALRRAARGRGGTMADYLSDIRKLVSRALEAV